MQTFTFKKVDSLELLKESYKLRFQVYCKECAFISEEDYPDEYETDRYDKDALHFGSLDEDENVVGSLRLILPSAPEFPIEKYCTDLTFDLSQIDRRQTAELSRLVISKLFRRITKSGMYYMPSDGKGVVKNNLVLDSFMRVRPMAFGFCREMYYESTARGIKYWFALMERKLFLFLKMNGILFQPIGDEIEYFGTVRPYLADVAEGGKRVCDPSVVN